MPDKIMRECDLCRNNYQMGPHRYEGKFIPRYQLSVCGTCYDGNWDGWAPHLEATLLAHLKKKGLSEPTRNAKGWFPRE